MKHLTVQKINGKGKKKFVFLKFFYEYAWKCKKKLLKNPEGQRTRDLSLETESALEQKLKAIKAETNFQME